MLWPTACVDHLPRLRSVGLPLPEVQEKRARLVTRIEVDRGGSSFSYMTLPPPLQKATWSSFLLWTRTVRQSPVADVCWLGSREAGWVASEPL